MSDTDATTGEPIRQRRPRRTSRRSRHPPFRAEELERLTGGIVAALKTVYDPEIPADIYELGLIYKVDIDDSRHVSVDMTLTAPGCPVAGDMPSLGGGRRRRGSRRFRRQGDLVFDPPWSPERMSDEAKVAIGWW